MLVALLWVAAVLNYLDRQVIFSVFPLLQKEFHIENIQLGLLGTVFLWVYGLLSPIAGYIADRFGKRRTIVSSLIVWSGMAWFTGHAHSFSQLLCAFGLMGVSEAFFLPAALAWISELHSDSSRSLATGLLVSGNYVGIVVGGVGGGWAGDHFGFRLPFTFLGLFGIGYTLPLWLLTRGRKDSHSSSEFTSKRLSLLSSLRHLLRLRSFVILGAVFTAVSSANWLIYAWLPLHIFERFHMSLARAGFAATFYIQVGGLAGVILGGSLADRWIRRSLQGRLWTQALGLAVSAPFLFIIGSLSSWLLLLLSLIAFGVGRGAWDSNAMPVLCQVARPALRATGYGIFNCVGCIAGGCVTLVTGWMKTHGGLSVAFQFAAGTWLLSACLLASPRLNRNPPAR